MMRKFLHRSDLSGSKCCGRKQEGNAAIQEVFVKSRAVVDLRVWRSDVGGALRGSTAAAGIHSHFHAVALALKKAHN